jgi:hypothetical protein
MKKLRSFFSTSLIVMASFASLHAMEPFVGEYQFLKSFIFDIQNEARDLTQDTGTEYTIVTQQMLLERCLKTLGLGLNSTPLDVKYHYELMKEKLVDRHELLNVVTKVYKQLIHMFFEIKKYEREIKYLVLMPFEELQAMELEDKDKFMQGFFLERTNKSIDAIIAQLEKQYSQYVISHQVSNQSGLPLILQTVFNLPADASPHTVDECYKKYMQEYQNYTSSLIAHATMKNISTNRLKNKLDEAAKVIEAYHRYVQKRDQK